MESSWKNIIYVNLGLTKFRKILNSGPTQPLFLFWIVFQVFYAAFVFDQCERLCVFVIIKYD